MTYPRNAWLEVDLGAIRDNVRALKSRTAKGTLFMAVVKADGYGHGAVAVAKAAVAAGAERLGVATVDEAIELRDAGITVPVQLLSEPPAASAPFLVERAIIPAVFTMGFARALDEAARAAGVVMPYHLKVDTGMGRIGVRADEAAEAALALRRFEGIRLEGVFTHFATADVPGDWAFQRQLERFEELLLRLKSEGVQPGIVHAANSAATILHPESHFGMVRCGIAIYGLHPDRSTYGKVDLRPSMSVKALLSHVKRIGMGEGVSYGLTWEASAPAVIATLPLGYADGVPRVASNRMHVLVGGVRCPQVGRVCMDQFMIELPRGVEALAGDEAVVVGAQGSQRIDMDELADAAQTINYEVACGFSRRLERRYL